MVIKFDVAYPLRYQARDGVVFYDVIRGYYPNETNGQLQKPEVQLKRLK